MKRTFLLTSILALTISNSTFATCYVGERCQILYERELDNRMFFTKPDPTLGTFKCSLYSQNSNAGVFISMMYANSQMAPRIVSLNMKHNSETITVTSKFPEVTDNVLLMGADNDDTYNPSSHTEVQCVPIS